MPRHLLSSSDIRQRAALRSLQFLQRSIAQSALVAASTPLLAVSGSPYASSAACCAASCSRFCLACSSIALCAAASSSAAFFLASSSAFFLAAACSMAARLISIVAATLARLAFCCSFLATSLLFWRLAFLVLQRPLSSLIVLAY